MTNSPTTLEEKKSTAATWFKALQDEICDAFESLEDDLTDGQKAHLDAGRFEKTEWSRDENLTPNASGSELKGGGRMAVMRGGRVFEKVGVNFSQVHGTFSEDFAKQIPGADESNGAFWA